jgi:hypothetical protein
MNFLQNTQHLISPATSATQKNVWQRANSVSLKRYTGFVEADFFSVTAPVFSYRLSVSGDGKTLTIVSLDPKTRRLLRARLVYRRA